MAKKLTKKNKMKNYGLEIHLNDNYVCRAGFENTYHVLTCIITSVRRKSGKSEELFMQISGLDSEAEQQHRWMNTDLKSGDKISIQVISDKFDKPSEIKERDSEKVILERKIKYFHQLKEELKDHLTDQT